VLQPEAAWLINPGSVGQPRDGDPRAAYALFDSETARLTLKRVEYDTQTVRLKIEQAGLPPVLGLRLGQGR
jgi:diadenosine tetraphosphatase ApaH/serine/threonine PP2A family protein phosphatase